MQTCSFFLSPLAFQCSHLVSWTSFFPTSSVLSHLRSVAQQILTRNTSSCSDGLQSIEPPASQQRMFLTTTASWSSQMPAQSMLWSSYLSDAEFEFVIDVAQTLLNASHARQHFGLWNKRSHYEIRYTVRSSDQTPHHTLNVRVVNHIGGT